MEEYKREQMCDKTELLLFDILQELKRFNQTGDCTYTIPEVKEDDHTHVSTDEKSYVRGTVNGNPLSEIEYPVKTEIPAEVKKVVKKRQTKTTKKKRKTKPKPKPKKVTI